MVVTCGCETHSSIILELSLTEENGCDLDSVAYDPSSPVYLSIYLRSYDSCRHLPEPKYHSFLFNH
jgi:hypothetical protein